MSADELVLHKDYEDFASSYLGVEYEDYVELMGDFDWFDFGLYEDKYALSTNFISNPL